MITIRQATITDLDALLPLFEGYRVFYKQEPQPEAARVFLTERFKNNESRIYIAFEKLDAQETAVGFTQLYPIFSSVTMQPMVLLNDLFIRPTHRGKSIGKQLIDTVKAYCIATQQKGVCLQTAHNNPAQRLYEREGFVKDTDLSYFWAHK